MVPNTHCCNLAVFIITNYHGLLREHGPMISMEHFSTYYRGSIHLKTLVNICIPKYLLDLAMCYAMLKVTATKTTNTI